MFRCDYNKNNIGITKIIKLNITILIIIILLFTTISYIFGYTIDDSFDEVDVYMRYDEIDTTYLDSHIATKPYLYYLAYDNGAYDFAFRSEYPITPKWTYYNASTVAFGVNVVGNTSTSTASTSLSGINSSTNWTDGQGVAGGGNPSTYKIYDLNEPPMTQAHYVVMNSMDGSFYQLYFSDLEDVIGINVSIYSSIWNIEEGTYQYVDSYYFDNTTTTFRWDKTKSLFDQQFTYKFVVTFEYTDESQEVSEIEVEHYNYSTAYSPTITIKRDFLEWEMKTNLQGEYDIIMEMYDQTFTREYELVDKLEVTMELTDEYSVFYEQAFSHDYYSLHIFYNDNLIYTRNIDNTILSFGEYEITNSTDNDKADSYFTQKNPNDYDGTDFTNGDTVIADTVKTLEDVYDSYSEALYFIGDVAANIVPQPVMDMFTVLATLSLLFFVVKIIRG